MNKRGQQQWGRIFDFGFILVSQGKLISSLRYWYLNSRVLVAPSSLFTGVHCGKPARNIDALKAKGRSHMRMLQKNPLEKKFDVAAFNMREAILMGINGLEPLVWTKRQYKKSCKHRDKHRGYTY